MVRWFVCPTVSMVTTGYTTGLEKTLYIDDTSIWSSDHCRGLVGGRLYWERGGTICSNSSSRVMRFNIILLKVYLINIFTIYTMVGTLSMHLAPMLYAFPLKNHGFDQ